jgi:hypothetical protein
VIVSEHDADEDELVKPQAWEGREVAPWDILEGSVE